MNALVLAWVPVKVYEIKNKSTFLHTFWLSFQSKIMLAIKCYK